MPRGQKLLISCSQVQNAINQAESNGPLDNRSCLWHNVAEILGVSTTSVIKIFNNNKLSCLTPLGKHGRQKGLAAIDRKLRKSKYQTSTGKRHIQSLLKSFSTKYHAVIRRMEKGSVKAAVKANCLACTAENHKEITECELMHCPLWLIRPFQKSQSATANPLYATANPLSATANP